MLYVPCTSVFLSNFHIVFVIQIIACNVVIHCYSSWLVWIMMLNSIEESFESVMNEKNTSGTKIAAVCSSWALF